MRWDRYLRRAAALVFLVGLLLGIGSPTTKAQNNNELETLNQQAFLFYQAGKYAEATDIAQRTLPPTPQFR
jgi:hypothetical protein